MSGYFLKRPVFGMRGDGELLEYMRLWVVTESSKTITCPQIVRYTANLFACSECRLQEVVFRVVGLLRYQVFGSLFFFLKVISWSCVKSFVVLLSGSR